MSERSYMTIHCQREVTLKSSLPIIPLQWFLSPPLLPPFLLSCKWKSLATDFTSFKAIKGGLCSKKFIQTFLHRDHSQTFSISYKTSLISRSSINCLLVLCKWSFIFFMFLPGAYRRFAAAEVTVESQQLNPGLSCTHLWAPAAQRQASVVWKTLRVQREREKILLQTGGGKK